MITESLEPDVQQAVRVLGQVPPAELRRMLAALGGSGPGGVEEAVAALERSKGSRRSDPARLPELIVFLAGPDLLASRKVREGLALAMDMEQLSELYESSSARNRRARSHAGRASAVAEITWHPGKFWARRFSSAVNLPLAFAGSRTAPQSGERIEVTPFVPLGELADFQDELRLAMLDTLRGAPGDNRAIMTLPTGAGKTRTAVEAIVQWLREARAERTVLWIAQSDELCEQAVQSFREVWVDLGHRSDSVREPLLIWRLWGDREVPAEPVDVVISSIQKLHALVRRAEEPIEAFDVDAIVIDEAHRALARSYGEVLAAFGINFRRRSSETPLLGLTATPVRTAAGETEALRRRFHNNVLRSQRLGTDPKTVLQRRGVLAHVDTEIISYDATIAFDLGSDPDQRSYFEQFEDIPPKLLKKLGSSLLRTRRLVERLEALDPAWPTLVFASSVDQARTIAATLRIRGRSADAITADTRVSTRHLLVERFREGGISVLSNYGVLTTGFDAPRVRAIVVARPTASRILYEQMIGRGLRGPRFGGTDRCLIIDLAENIRFEGKDVVVRYDTDVQINAPSS